MVSVARCGFVSLAAIVAALGLPGGWQGGGQPAPEPGQQPSRAAALIVVAGSAWTGVPVGAAGDAEEGEGGAADAVDAVAIAGERILAVGSADEVMAHRGPDTRVVEAPGALLLPGFIDNHVHFSSAGRLLLGVNLLDVEDEGSFVEAVRAADERMPEGSWLVGGDWSAYQRWPRGAERPRQGEIDYFEPHRRMVDGIVDRPMLLSRFDREVWFANGPALEAAGIDASTADPQGGRIVRDAAGEPTGLLLGTAVEMVRRVVPEPSHRQRVAETRVALQRVRENGVTAFHDMSPPWQLRIYQQMLHGGELTARVHYRPTLDRYELLADLGVQADFGGQWIQLGAVKGFVDGIMGNSTALFFEPYDHRPDSRGRLRDMMFPEGNMLRLVRGADAAALQVSIHAIGDAANRLLLDIFEQVFSEHGPRDRRFRVVHAQVLHPDDLPRFGRLGLVAEVQPYHAIDDMRWMEERIGERSRWAYAFRSLQDSGAVLSFGSDWPGTNAAWYPISPLLGIYAAVTRQTLGGAPEGGWYPEERISVEDALRAYTVNNAYMAFDEDERGTLEPGKLADVTVVDRDIRAIPPERIKDAAVLYTIVGGRIVYAADGGGAPASR